MNKFFIVLLTVATSYIAVAQKTTQAEKEQKKLDRAEKGYRNEIGVNTTFFLNEVTDLSDKAIGFFPYMVSYKYVGLSQWGFRMAAGAFYKDQVSTQNGIAVALQNARINARTGWEYQVTLSPRWRMNVGMDVIFDYVKKETVSNSGFDIVKLTTTDFGIGGGPVLGISFRPLKRLSISTETALYYRNIQTTEVQTFQSFPDFDVRTNFSRNELRFFIPASVIIAIHF